MKIAHLCLGAFYPDGYSYQENMLPKFHKKMGYEVEVIASRETFDENGKRSFIDFVGSYKNEFDIKVTRLQYCFPEKLNHKFKAYRGVYQAISDAKPDILFIHNCQFLSLYTVLRYIKENNNIQVYVDNHVDFSNSAKTWLSKNVLHKLLWRFGACRIEPYVKNFYGVLPARVDWLIDMYKLPKEKCKLLVMGADDEKVEECKNPEIKKEIRRKYNIASDDFLIVTGGKIDLPKQQVLLLMEAVHRICNSKVKLIVFGSAVPELKDKIVNLSDGEKVQYIGWISSNESYKYFAAADLVVFPGRHSVFWEQACGQGKPMIVKYWEGTTHVDLGGNVEFLYTDSTEEIYAKINELLNSPEKFTQMREIAESKGMDVFSYKKIAARAIDVE